MTDKYGFTAQYYVKHDVPNLEELVKQFKEQNQLPPVLQVVGVAIDSTMNKNRWQVPQEDLTYVAETLKGATYRVDHSESVRDVIGKVIDAWVENDKVYYKAETDDPEIIRKVLRGYLDKDSIQVDSDEVICSKCYEEVLSRKANADDLIRKGRYYSRQDGRFRHLCNGAHEIVRKPVVRELSIVATPAYDSAVFKPIGFSASLNQILTVISNEITDDASIHKEDCIDADMNVRASKEIDKMSEQTPQNKESGLKAQAGVVNVSGETQAPSNLDYNTFINALVKANIQDMIKPVIDPVVADVKSLSQKYEEVSKKVDEVLKKLEVSEAGRKLATSRKKEEEEDEDEEDEEEEEAKKEVRKKEEDEEPDEDEEEEEDEDEEDDDDDEDEEEVKKEARKKVKGKSKIASESPQYSWFQELYALHKKTPGFRG